MKRSANIETLYTELPWPQRFAAAAKDGFEYVEFWSWANKDLDEVARLLASNKLKISAMSGDLGYSLCDPEAGEKYLAFIEESIAAAKRIGCPTLVIHSNALRPDGTVADYFERYSDTVKICTMFDSLCRIKPLAEAAGITFVLEALNVVREHVGNYLRYTQQSAELTSLVKSPRIKILYDAYHMYLNEGKLCETLSQYVDQIGYIHIADAPGRAEPGTGAINYRNVFAHLKEIGYDRVVGFELFPKKDTATAIRAIMECSAGL